MERIVLKLGMFETLMVAVIAIYVGEFLRNKIPVLKKYCLPAAVVGGTLFALLSLLLYSVNIFELNFDYKLVIIFTILAALLAALQNAAAISVGSLFNISPLISMMTGSIPMTGGHGNAASFAPIAVEAGATAAMEVAIAAATFGLISGCILGGPFGNFMVKRFHLENPELDGKEEAAELKAEGSGGTAGALVDKANVLQAVFMLCIACGIGQVLFLTLKYFKINFPIHVCCMFGGIAMRLLLDLTSKTNPAKHNVLYDAFDIVGEFSLALFVSMSIVSMKLWQLAGLGTALVVLLLI